MTMRFLLTILLTFMLSNISIAASYDCADYTVDNLLQMISQNFENADLVMLVNRSEDGGHSVKRVWKGDVGTSVYLESSSWHYRGIAFASLSESDGSLRVLKTDPCVSAQKLLPVIEAVLGPGYEPTEEQENHSQQDISWLLGFSFLSSVSACAAAWILIRPDSALLQSAIVDVMR